jgi:glycosyltransferase involved in cell wall biosynthesis
MKIGFFTDTYFPQINGVTYTILLWKKELEKLGHEVFVYYPKDKDYKPDKNEVPLRSIPFLFYKGYNIGLPSFSKIEKDLDIVHIHGFVSVSTLGLAVSRKQKIPRILTYHTPPDMYLQQISSNELIQESMKVLYYKYEKELLERCTLITAPSETIMKILKERLGKHIVKSTVFSNGIDMDFFQEVEAEKFRKDYGIQKGRVIGFAGRHSKEKHLEDLINFADEFDGTILILGDGKQSQEYKRMAEGKKNVRFLGFIPRERLPEFYSCIDVLVLPSTAETEGLVVLEANACGTPAVGANAMALKNTIKEGVNGYLYEPSDMRGLSEKVQKAYKNINKLKASSKKRANERSVENTVKRLIKIYEGLI